MTAVAEQRRTATTVTLELEPELAEGLARIADARSTSVQALIAAAAERFLDEDDAARLAPFTPDQVKQIELGIEDVRAGRTYSNEEVFAELHERFRPK